MEPRPTVRTAEAGVGVQKPGGYAASAVDAAKLVEPEGTEKQRPGQTPQSATTSPAASTASTVTSEDDEEEERKP